MLRDELMASIRRREARIAVIGLGYVGLPLSMLFARAGFRVVGFDVDEVYTAELTAGHSRVGDVGHAALRAEVEAGRFVATAQVEDLRGLDVYLICVPTPLSKTRQPDLTYIQAAVDTVASVLEEGKLVVLESTTYPGTTEDLVLPRLRASGFELDRSMLLAFSSERVDPGNLRFPLEVIPKVVGGVTDDSTAVAAELYHTVFETVHKVSSATVAETSKLLENTFRNVNIALANEFKQLCDKIGIDVWEVIEAARTKPFGFMAFYPGPGIGGHCIPLDPQYLVYRARLSGFEPRLVITADQINQGMPHYVVVKAMEALNERGVALRGAHVLMVGVAYKPDVPDVRESPALPVLDELLRFGADIHYADPHVPTLRLDDGSSLASEVLDAAAVAKADLIIVITAHQAIDFSLLLAAEDKVLDTRNVMTAVRRAHVLA